MTILLVEGPAPSDHIDPSPVNVQPGHDRSDRSVQSRTCVDCGGAHNAFYRGCLTYSILPYTYLCSAPQILSSPPQKIISYTSPNNSLSETLEDIKKPCLILIQPSVSHSLYAQSACQHPHCSFSHPTPSSTSLPTHPNPLNHHCSLIVSSKFLKGLCLPFDLITINPFFPFTNLCLDHLLTLFTLFSTMLS